MPYVQCNKTAHCDICPIAKQKRLSFSASTHVSNQPLNWYMMICGVPFLYLLLMVTSMSLPWLMIFLDVHKLNQNLKFFYHSFMLMLKLNLTKKSNALELIMVLSFC